jgi:iron complex outermembrane receptor protein
MPVHATTRLLIGSATIAIAIMAHPAWAADAAPPVATATTDAAPAEIIVTAQRRAERVTEVPISITVADSAQLEREQVDTVGDLSRIAPSLEINNAPGQNTGGGGAIRGIGTQTFSAGAVPSVGVVVDQVSQGNANISNLFDVARVEVLKGPQGTLFGLTTSAGVINITTNKPQFDTLSLRLRTELSGSGIAGSQYGDQIAQGVVNIPIAANAALRVSGFANLRQGPDYDVTTQQYDANDSFGFRGHLLWEPSSELTINLIGDYTKTRITNGGDFFTFVTTSGPGLLPLATPFPIPDNVTANLASCGVTPGVGNRNYCMANSFVDHSYNGGASLEIDYNAQAFTITSISAYRHSLESGLGAATSVFRGDPLELQVSNGAIYHPIDLASEELRISSSGKQTIEYTAGLFVSSQVQNIAPETLSVVIHPAPPVYIPVANGGTGGYRVTDTSAAAFGQLTAHVADKLRLIAGGRYTKDDLHLTTYADAIPGSTDSYTALNVGKFSWKVGVQYDVAPRTMAYATVSRGFKGGQISQPSGAAPYPILPEIPTSYEAGLKSTLFGSWVLDTNVFYQKVQNFQAQSCSSITSGPLAGTLSCIQTNIDGVKSRGAEINLFGKVTRNLSLNTGFIWAKATYPTGFLGSDGSNLGGQQLAYAPEYKFTMSGEYTARLGDNLNGFLAADTIWKSRVSYEETSVQGSTFGPHWTIGGRVGVRTADDRFTVAVFARNLGNVHEPILMQSGFPYGGAANIGAMYGPNGFRQVGLSLDGKF